MKFLTVCLVLYLVNVYASTSCFDTIGPEFNNGSSIGRIYLNGEGNDINDLTMCPNVAGVRNLSSLDAVVYRSHNYNLDYTLATCSETQPFSAQLWIDFNNDGFPSEIETFVLNSIYGSWTISFQIPSNATKGNVDMVIQMQDLVSLPIDFCQNFTSGSTKLFTLTIKDVPPKPDYTVLIIIGIIWGCVILWCFFSSVCKNQCK